MRHARREMRENLITIARIATGGHVHGATLASDAPGCTYHQLARQFLLENLFRTARDSSPATEAMQPTCRAPGGTYSNSLAFEVAKTSQ